MNLALVAYTARTLADYRGTHPDACEAEARLMLHAVELFEQRKARRDLGIGYRPAPRHERGGREAPEEVPRV